MVNAVRSAVGMARSLLPLGTGGPLPVAPKPPDLPSFLDQLTSMLRDLLGQAPAAPESPGRPAGSAFQTVPAARESSASPRETEGEAVRDREESPRETARRPEEAPADRVPVPTDPVRRFLEEVRQAGQDGSDPAAPPPVPVRDLLSMLNELRERAGLPAVESSIPEAETSPLPTPLPAAGAGPEPAPAPPAAVELPPGVLPEAEPPELFPARPTPSAEFAPLPDAPGAEDPPPPTGEVAKTGATDADAAPAATAQGSVLEAVSLAVAKGQDAPAAARSGPAVGGLVEPGSARSTPTGATAAAEAHRPENRGEMVERIVKAARLTQSRGSARIKIALHPPHLGELKVDLSVRQRVLHGTLQAESAAAREMLLSNLQSLRDALEQQGIRVGEFQVQVDQSFQQATRDPEERRPRAGTAPYGSGLSEGTGPAPDPRPRSARLQVIDVVA